jgi:hypothetical protein
MDLIKAFETNAAECRAQARKARDRETRATWMEMAERWQRLAADHPLAKGPRQRPPGRLDTRRSHAA